MSSQSRQQGAVLIVALIFTAILTVLGVGGMRSATLQERMAGNSRDINVAFQAAEAALREAETLMGVVSSIDFDGSNGLYLSCPDPTDKTTACSQPDWKSDSATGWRQVSEQLPDVNRQPEFIIEQISASIDVGSSLDSDRTIAIQGYYRITARGFGASDRSMIVLATTYRREES